MTPIPTAGASFDVAYPFHRVVVSLADIDGWIEGPTWVPGIRFEPIPPDDTESVADGLGMMRLTVVSAHKPGRYPTRVFFTRQWVDPDGKTFGKNRLRIATAQSFTILLRGYRHRYRLLDRSTEARPTPTPETADA